MFVRWRFIYSEKPEHIAHGVKSVFDIERISNRLKKETKDGQLKRFDVRYPNYIQANFYVERRKNLKQTLSYYKSRRK